MFKKSLLMCLVFLMVSCKESKKNEDAQNEISLPMTETETIIDSLIYFKNNHLKTDFLSLKFPDLSRDKAVEFQLGSLEKEIKNGEEHAGWKMGGTVGDSLSFDPIMGYMLNKNRYSLGEKISIKNFPESQVAIEGEVGFVFKKDFPKGVNTIEGLKAGIDYAVGAVEFAQSNAIGINNDPETLKTNHVLAFGTAQAGFMLGTKKIAISDFDISNESVECFIDNKSVAAGQSSRIYNGHLNALYSLANLLPKYGLKIRKGDVVITGSMYVNPIVKGKSQVKLVFNSLGTIEFEITD